MIFKIDNPKFARHIFVAASMTAALSLACILIFGKIIFEADLAGRAQADSYVPAGIREGDPLTTRIPGLKDVIKTPLASMADPVLGPADAAVAAVIFSDFDCRFCRNQEEVLKELLALYPGSVKLVRKDYPENLPGSASWLSAIAGRCAQTQGRFWQLHDALYGGRAPLDREEILRLAGGLGLDRKKFQRCLDGSETKTLIDDNIAEADALGLSGVPFVFINDQEFLGEAGLEELKMAVEEELDGTDIDRN